MSKKISIEGKDLTGTYRDLLFDKQGRFGQSYYFRDITKTAYATLTRVTETEIMPGVAGEFHDLVVVTGANTSTNAIRVDLRCGTGGTALDSLVVPAANVVQKTYEVPLLASEKDQTWTGKCVITGEISDSPVSITLIAVKNT